MLKNTMKKIIKSYKAVELSELEGKTKPTIYNNGGLYVPISIPSKRSQKWYSIRYIKKSDLDDYFSSVQKLIRDYYSWKKNVLDFIVADMKSTEEIVKRMLDLNEEFWKLAKWDLEKEKTVLEWVYSDIHWCGWDSSEKYMYFWITA